MGMDVSGINPTTISEPPSRPDWQTCSDEERDAYFEASNKYHAENPGVYFRANVWSWRPILEAMWESGACYEVDDKTWELMAFNDGAGAKDAETCKRMAKKIRMWLQEKIWDEDSRWTPESLDDREMQINDKGQFISKTEAELKNIETKSPYQVSKEHLESWCDFLENCGGFEVW